MKAWRLGRNPPSCAIHVQEPHEKCVTVSHLTTSMQVEFINKIAGFFSLFPGKIGTWTQLHVLQVRMWGVTSMEDAERPKRWPGSADFSYRLAVTVRTKT